ncbi:MAG: phosphoribosylformylglycinamidine cyclo-ligase [Syntrophales bacterium]|mgnify:FL=1|jgi:phosphoribosylformylglycinamidine cyclo-ligase|nr:phosphoribosylformylglycinamidine cyclo-ligase [Syntrophales bacterium]MDD4339179.1 phosphoribosylformylglycinamidine cyclo-ligase [Syntrophales bacterium]HOG07044.1 phosphoribosylformylglycinamidine cyclo-ligase [Syntrophales bacterium]HOS78306.1 phosphoribosylformylglycinamidine cyclo-ligase [Syntrophales bacterium]HPB70447.1 phosphoribosylformylglycinamidine cyclo-ligase [Syntrophales bacterium]
MSDNASYKTAGVDIDEANRFVERLKPLVKTTFRKEVMSGIGGFGGLFHLDPEKYRDPVLVSSTDGVGTKLKIAQEMMRHDTIGIDLVAMSVNDIVVQGAEPLFFLDYLSLGKIDVGRCLEILDGIVRGCQDAGCALIGGETAEMPGFYRDDEYDLAGFCVGIVDADRLLDGSGIRVGDRIIGLASSGLHSNGFSLARHVLFERGGYRLGDRLEEFDNTIGDELLTPTRIYVRTVLNLIKNFTVKGIVHITGGGFIDNIPRIIPAASRVIIQMGAWPIHPVFSAIQEIGNIVDDEMYRVFNMGIGMMLVVPEKESGEILERLEQMGEKAYLIGQIDKRDSAQPSVVLLPPA